MARKNSIIRIFRYISLVSLFLLMYSCDSEYLTYNNKTYNNKDLIGDWVCEDPYISLSLCEDSIFIADLIPNVQIFLGIDSVYEQSTKKYIKYKKYQAEGIVGKWELDTDKDSKAQKIILKYDSDKTNPGRIEKKELNIAKGYIQFLANKFYGDCILIEAPYQEDPELFSVLTLYVNDEDK